MSTPIPSSSSIPPPTTTSANQSSSPSSSPFPFPREHSFPPFFTLQPNTTTQHAQCQKWSALIQAYCRHQRLFKLSLSSALETPLFHNSAINRRLSAADAKEILAYMVKEGRAEWVAAKGTGEVLWIWWRTPEEWAAVLETWVDETAQKGVVLTLYELVEGEATISQEFHAMDPEVLQKALGILVKRGKAQVFGSEDQQGVKFF